MALRRGCSLSPEELELRRDDLLNPRSYAVQLAGRDVAIEPQDFDEALYTLGTAPREQYEQAWPSLDVMIAAVLEAGKQRRIAANRSRSLGDGRRPGESELEQWKREADTEAPDAELQARIDRLNAKIGMDKKSTQPTQESTPSERGSIRRMTEDDAEVLFTFLDALVEMTEERRFAAVRAVATCLRTDDIEGLRDGMRLLWPKLRAETEQERRERAEREFAKIEKTEKPQ